ncbi:hypothetical protein HG530_008970 [Fusarium avenaceum]|nr:hypothetical protein HG530_008970 [Fusarium avenaceum]
MAISEHAKMPSVASGPISVWRLGVSRNGTGSGLWKKGLLALIYDIISDPQTLPVDLDILIFCGYRLCMYMIVRGTLLGTRGTYRALALKGTPKLLHSKQNRVILRHAHVSTMILIHSLQCGVGRVFLYKSDVWRERNHDGYRELQIATSALLLTAQCLVKRPEELQDALLSSAVTGCRVLNGPFVDAAIMSTHLDTAIRSTNRPHEVYVWQESIDTDEVLVLILVLQILAGNLNLVKLSVSELAQMRREHLE